MVPTKQKPTVYTQKIKRRESRHTTKESHQFKKEGSKRGRKGTKEPENNGISKSLPINTDYNVNGLNTSIKDIQ